MKRALAVVAAFAFWRNGGGHVVGPPPQRPARRATPLADAL